MVSRRSSHQRVFVGALLWLVGSAAHACECFWEGGFLEAQTKADVVLLGTVSGHSGNSLDMAVDEVLRGKEWRLDVRVWGDNGKLCRPSIYRFEPGSQWVMALRRINDIPKDGFDPDTPNLSYGRVGDYEISACGANWMELQEGHIKGNLAGGPQGSHSDANEKAILVDLLRAWFAGEQDTQTLTELAKRSKEERKLLESSRGYVKNQEAIGKTPTLRATDATASDADQQKAVATIAEVEAMVRASGLDLEQQDERKAPTPKPVPPDNQPEEEGVFYKFGDQFTQPNFELE